MKCTAFWTVCLSVLAVWAPDTDCHAFDLSTHRTILLDALDRSNFTVNGKTLSFDADVALKIDDENGALDRGALLGSDPLWHVDNEKIAESNLRTIDYRSKVLKELRT